MSRTEPAEGPAAVTGSGSWSVPRELVLQAALAAAAAAATVFLPAPGGDAAAHLYRTSLVHHGILVWDNLWFAGSYPLLSYSVLYYLLAALVGNVTVAFASVVLSAVLFGSILERRWGPVARWPARSFAVLVTGQLFTAAYPFDAGLATLLASLWALQRGRRMLASAAALLTVVFSPLAFGFLVIAAAAVLLHERRLTRGTVLYGTTLAFVGSGVWGLALLAGAAHLVYPFGLWRFLVGTATAAAGYALVRRRRRVGPLPMLFLVWSLATAVVFAVPSAVGHNILRASVFVFPLMLLGAQLRGFRPRVATIAATAGALGVVTVPYLSMIDARAADPLASPASWRGTIGYLRRHETADYRVEVVPTANHWEAYFVARAGFPLARGWYRQLDLADDRALYAPTLTGIAYRHWLRAEGIRYVVLSTDPPEAIDGTREAMLLRSGVSGLRRVWSNATTAIYELARPTPLLTGPGRAAVTRMTSSLVAGHASRPGRYLLRIHYTRTWGTRPSSVCVQPAGTGHMTELDLTRPGSFVLRAAETPTGFIDGLLDPPPSCTGRAG